MRVRIDVTGDQEVKRGIERLGKAGIEAAKRVLGEVCKEIVPRAKQMAPVDPEDGGQLRDSIRTTKPTQTRTGLVSAGVVAGGAPLKKVEGPKRFIYAVIQHEDLTLRHTVGRAKFLEIPFMAAAPSVPDRLIRELDSEAAK